jgi:hypothetical protein
MNDNREDLDPKVWGPHYWFMLETVGIGLPEDIDETTEYLIKQFLVNLSFLLPCTKCRDHYTKYLEDTEIDRLDFSKKVYVQTWLNNLHNMHINPPRTLSQVINYYDNQFDKNKTTYKDIVIIVVIVAALLFMLKYMRKITKVQV